MGGLAGVGGLGGPPAGGLGGPAGAGSLGAGGGVEGRGGCAELAGAAGLGGSAGSAGSAGSTGFGALAAFSASAAAAFSWRSRSISAADFTKTPSGSLGAAGSAAASGWSGSPAGVLPEAGSASGVSGLANSSRRASAEILSIVLEALFTSKPRLFRSSMSSLFSIPISLESWCIRTLINEFFKSGCYGWWAVPEISRFAENSFLLSRGHRLLRRR